MVDLIAPNGEHEWSREKGGEGHYCYFCQPRRYPPMRPLHTLCARCGALIRIAEHDPMNLALELCPPCEVIVLQH